MKRRNRVVEVNRALRAAGASERLTRGAGYYYFSGGDAFTWPSSSVYVYRASDLSVAEWLAEYRALKAEGRAR